jgi:hypothetical protein
VVAAPRACWRAFPPQHRFIARRHPLAGNPLEKGISGGQSKRTNIGIALITNPRVLMLDEPTSGLDSFTANEVRVVGRAPPGEGQFYLGAWPCRAVRARWWLPSG